MGVFTPGKVANAINGFLSLPQVLEGQSPNIYQLSSSQSRKGQAHVGGWTWRLQSPSWDCLPLGLRRGVPPPWASQTAAALNLGRKHKDEAADRLRVYPFHFFSPNAATFFGLLD